VTSTSPASSAAVAEREDPSDIGHAESYRSVMSDTITNSTDRAALASARDQMRRDLNERFGTTLTENTRRYEEAYTSYLDADGALETARLRVEAATKRQADSIAKADQLESEAAKLPADSTDREEKLELAAKLRIASTAEQPIIDRTKQNIPELEQQSAAHKAKADEIEAASDRHTAQVNAAEEQLDRLDDKIRLIDRERAATASAREADAEAEALEMQGDVEGAAAHRSEAARLRAEADRAASDGAAITVDTKALTDVGLDVPATLDDATVTSTGDRTEDPAPAAGPSDVVQTPGDPSTGDDSPDTSGSDPDGAPGTGHGALTAQELSDRADMLTDQATRLRRELLDSTEAKFGEIGITRDRAARDQYGAEQSAASADIQVKRERREADEATKGAADEEAKAAAAEKRGDAHAAEEMRENAMSLRSAADVHAQRARQATLDAAELREEAAQHARRVVELETEQADLRSAGGAAAAELDKMEDQARLLDEAARKMTEAAQLRDSGQPMNDKVVGTIGELEDEAEKALAKAAGIEIDRGSITAVLPDAQIGASVPVPTSDTEATVAAASGALGSDDDILALHIEAIEPTTVDDDAAGASDATAEPDGDTARSEAATDADTSWLREVIEEPAPVGTEDTAFDTTSTFEQPDLEPPVHEDFAEATASAGASPGDDARFDELAE
jgi:hypothetical protein